jgi:hypothetical protein
MSEQHNLVINFVDGGLPLQSALIAADIVATSKFEEVYHNKRLPVPPETHIAEDEDLFTVLERQFPGSLMAKKLGLGTREFNRRLQDQGFFKRVPLSKKRVRGTHGLVSTYVLTEKGQQFGRSEVYLSYEDGKPAVYKHFWSDALIGQLKL